MSKNFGKLLLVIALLATSLNLFARRIVRDDVRKVTLHYNGQVFQGGALLKLKQRLRQDGININFNRTELKAVVLVAKSKKGHGTASLIVGQNRSYPETIPGAFQDFRNPANWTFHRIQLQNPSYNSNGNLQIQLNGKISVQKVILKLQDSYRPAPIPRPVRVQYTTLGEFKVDKFIETERTFRPGRRNVSTIKLVTSRAAVEVVSAYIQFGNGEIRYLNNLQGYIGEGRERVARIDFRRNIRKISITATSPGLFGSRGKLNVSIGTLR